MKKIALAVLGLASLVGPALAADLGARPVYKAPPVAAPVMSWTGCYLGAGGGYGMFNDDTTSVTSGLVVTPKQTFGGRGWFGTVQGGCDYQFAPSWVIGAFADYDFGSIKGDVSAFNTELLGTEKLNWSWAAGGRIGYLPTDRLLAYVSAGGTQAHFKEINYTFLGVFPGYSTAAHTFTGWFIGSGYEYNLGFLPGLFWKTEYRFADYGSHTDPLLLNGAPTTSAIDHHPYVQTIRSELVYRFNWPR